MCSFNGSKSPLVHDKCPSTQIEYGGIYNLPIFQIVRQQQQRTLQACNQLVAVDPVLTTVSSRTQVAHGSDEYNQREGRIEKFGAGTSGRWGWGGSLKGANGAAPAPGWVVAGRSA